MMSQTVPHHTELNWESPDPSARAELLGILLADVEHHLRRYVVLTEQQTVAVTLWVAHTHVLSAFEYTPYLNVNSATKRSGKTVLLETCEGMVARPWFTGRTSAAALVRKINAERPTLLLDESDAAFNGEKEYAEALRGILNTGFKASGKTTLCVGQGANITYQDFSTFSPKAIAGIGRHLPDTVADRSIPIVLRRRLSTETIERFRGRDVRALAAPIAAGLKAWGTTAVEVLRSARPPVPENLNDRAADVWEPLLAVADLAGGTWPARARAAALSLMDTLDDNDPRVELLLDILTALDADDPELSDVIPSSTIHQALIAMEDRPWPTWSHGKPLTPHRLARMLSDFGIHSSNKRVGPKVVKAYRRDALVGACARYLPSKALHRNKTNNDGHELAIPYRNGEDPCSAEKTAVASINTAPCCDVALLDPEQSEVPNDGLF